MSTVNIIRASPLGLEAGINWRKTLILIALGVAIGLMFALAAPIHAS